jgi:ankyrin repeat protein
MKPQSIPVITKRCLAMVFVFTVGVWWIGMVGAEETLDEQLIQATVQRDVALVKRLLAKGADVNARDKDGWTVLMRAAPGGNVELLEVLVAGGADVNAKNHRGWTALIRTVDRGGSEKALRLLLDRGADVNARTIDHRTALLEAAAGEHQLNGPKWYLVPWYLARMLLFGPQFGEWYPSGLRDPATVKLLLQKGADVNAKDARGRTALQRAQQRGASEIVEVLRSY